MLPQLKIADISSFSYEEIRSFDFQKIELSFIQCFSHDIKELVNRLKIIRYLVRKHKEAANLLNLERFQEILQKQDANTTKIILQIVKYAIANGAPNDILGQLFPDPAQLASLNLNEEFEQVQWIVETRGNLSVAVSSVQKLFQSSCKELKLLMANPAVKVVQVVRTAINIQVPIEEYKTAVNMEQFVAANKPKIEQLAKQQLNLPIEHPLPGSDSSWFNSVYSDVRMIYMNSQKDTIKHDDLSLNLPKWLFDSSNWLSTNTNVRILTDLLIIASFERAIDKNMELCEDAITQLLKCIVPIEEFFREYWNQNKLPLHSSSIKSNISKGVSNAASNWSSLKLWLNLKRFEIDKEAKNDPFVYLVVSLRYGWLPANPYLPEEKYALLITGLKHKTNLGLKDVEEIQNGLKDEFKKMRLGASRILTKYLEQRPNTNLTNQLKQLFNRISEQEQDLDSEFEKITLRVTIDQAVDFKERTFKMCLEEIKRHNIAEESMRESIQYVTQMAMKEDVCTKHFISVPNDIIERVCFSISAKDLQPNFVYGLLGILRHYISHASTSFDEQVSSKLVNALSITSTDDSRSLLRDILKLTIKKSSEDSTGKFWNKLLIDSVLNINFTFQKTDKFFFLSLLLNKSECEPIDNIERIENFILSLETTTLRREVHKSLSLNELANTESTDRFITISEIVAQIFINQLTINHNFEIKNSLIDNFIRLLQAQSTDEIDNINSFVRVHASHGLFLIATKRHKINIAKILKYVDDKEEARIAVFMSMCLVYLILNYPELIRKGDGVINKIANIYDSMLTIGKEDLGSCWKIKENIISILKINAFKIAESDFPVLDLLETLLQEEEFIYKYSLFAIVKEISKQFLIPASMLSIIESLVEQYQEEHEEIPLVEILFSSIKQGWTLSDYAVQNYSDMLMRLDINSQMYRDIFNLIDAAIIEQDIPDRAFFVLELERCASNRSLCNWKNELNFIEFAIQRRQLFSAHLCEIFVQLIPQQNYLDILQRIVKGELCIDYSFAPNLVKKVKSNECQNENSFLPLLSLFKYMRYQDAEFRMILFDKLRRAEFYEEIISYFIKDTNIELKIFLDSILHLWRTNKLSNQNKVDCFKIINFVFHKRGHLIDDTDKDLLLKLLIESIAKFDGEQLYELSVCSLWVAQSNLQTGPLIDSILQVYKSKQFDLNPKTKANFQLFLEIALHTNDKEAIELYLNKLLSQPDEIEFSNDDQLFLEFILDHKDILNNIRNNALKCLIKARDVNSLSDSLKDYLLNTRNNEEIMMRFNLTFRSNLILKLNHLEYSIILKSAKLPESIKNLYRFIHELSNESNIKQLSDLLNNARIFILKNPLQKNETQEVPSFLISNLYNLYFNYSLNEESNIWQEIALFISVIWKNLKISDHELAFMILRKSVELSKINNEIIRVFIENIDYASIFIDQYLLINFAMSNPYSDLLNVVTEYLLALSKQAELENISISYLISYYFSQTNYFRFQIVRLLMFKTPPPKFKKRLMDLYSRIIPHKLKDHYTYEDKNLVRAIASIQFLSQIYMNENENDKERLIQRILFEDMALVLGGEMLVKEMETFLQTDEAKKLSCDQHTIFIQIIHDRMIEIQHNKESYQSSLTRDFNKTKFALLRIVFRIYSGLIFDELVNVFNNSANPEIILINRWLARFLNLNNEYSNINEILILLIENINNKGFITYLQNILSLCEIPPTLVEATEILQLLKSEAYPKIDTDFKKFQNSNMLKYTLQSAILNSLFPIESTNDISTIKKGINKILFELLFTFKWDYNFLKRLINLIKTVQSDSFIQSTHVREMFYFMLKLIVKCNLQNTNFYDYSNYMFHIFLTGKLYVDNWLSQFLLFVFGEKYFFDSEELQKEFENSNSSLNDNFIITSFINFYKQINNDLDIQNPANIGNPQDTSMFTLFCRISSAVKKLFGYNLRGPQIIAILCCLKNESASDRGRLLQVATGEGKTLIIAIISLIKAIQGFTVDVITSSSPLAERDSKKMIRLYKEFGISCSHNVEHITYNNKPKQCYKSKIVYGDITQFQFDYLRDNMYGFGTLCDRSVEHSYLIIDECDSILIDGATDVAKLAGAAVGNDLLLPFLCTLWNCIGSKLLPLKDEFLLLKYRYKLICGTLLVQEVNEDGDIKDVAIPDISYLEDIIDARIGRAKIENAILIRAKEILKFFIENEKPPWPPYLKTFAEIQITQWTNSLITACLSEENIDFIIRNEEIIPVDYSNTGVLQFSTQWANGLHQFLQIKHGLRVTCENLTSNFISNYNFVLRYKFVINLKICVYSERIL
jgi:hypothetical protein